MKKTYVTIPFLPEQDKFQEYIAEIFERKYLTNQGPLLHKLEQNLKEYLDVENLHVVANGTLALQLALNALDIKEGEIITTPFSFVATISSILWERCKPVFVDIESDNFTIDSNKIEEKITQNTKAILAVNVFGYACNIYNIQNIADKHNLKVIYDSAHCFGSKYKGKSLASYGDISILSFHSTKIYHTIEGGACIIKDKQISSKLELIKKFGCDNGEPKILGINAKASEFQAAMGLANLPYIKNIIEKRKNLSKLYDQKLDNLLKRPSHQKELEYNYSYYPVLFKSEKELLSVFEALNNEEIYPKRYFYPSLNTLPYVTGDACPISEDISKRIACLPLYDSLEEDDVIRICKIVKKDLKTKN